MAATTSNFLKGDSAAANHAFLQSQCPTRREALNNLNALERMYFQRNIILRPLSRILPLASKVSQKTHLWLQLRRGRITGSLASSSVGHNPSCSPIRAALDFTHSTGEIKKSSEAMDWGSGKETYAAQCYMNNLQQMVTREFRRQRLERAMEAEKTNTPFVMTHFEFRGKRFPVSNPHRDPVAKLHAYGLLFDLYNHQRAVSPDGIVTINGVILCCIEIKCPFLNNKENHINFKTYYYDQLMSELYMVQMYAQDKNVWLDMINWSPAYFTVDAFQFDDAYFFGWYAPRELRFYYNLHLPLLSQHLRNLMVSRALDERVDLLSLDESTLERRAEEAMQTYALTRFISKNQS